MFLVLSTAIPAKPIKRIGTKNHSNSNRSIVFRLVWQSNIIEQELFGEFDFRTSSNQSNLMDAISSISFGGKTKRQIL